MLSLIVAGITALPFFGWAMVSVVPVLAILSIVPLYFLVYRKNNKNASAVLLPCNVIITGGSSGIGLAIAHECCTLPHVQTITLIARNEAKLNDAKKELLEGIKNPSVATIQVLSADVTNHEELLQAVDAIPMQESTYLFCCAGMAHPGYFHELSPTVFQQQVQLNYLGTVFTVKALLPHMSAGCITMTSSGAGQVGVFGYSAYAPTKFALRGFAECLFMELLPTDISVQLAFPNDTNTPGYAQEEARKPIECQLVSESGGLAEANV